MLRYVYVGDQILDGASQFSLYDTVFDGYLIYVGCQVFDDLDGLLEVYDADKYPHHTIERIKALMPKE